MFGVYVIDCDVCAAYVYLQFLQFGSNIGIGAHYLRNNVHNSLGDFLNGFETFNRLINKLENVIISFSSEQNLFGHLEQTERFGTFRKAGFTFGFERSVLRV